MRKQNELFVMRTMQPEGNSERSLLDMLKKYEADQIVTPQFQRDGGLWDKNKIIGWINTIISLKAIGVIVTYQVGGEGTVYLLDGLQRITATRKFLDSPEFYGFDIGEGQASDYCDSFTITVQHRHYQTHEEAMEHFQNINKGTTLTPREFYRGHLALDRMGKLVDTMVPPIVDRYFSEFMSTRKRGREKSSKLDRDSFALFFQYVTGSKAKSFWNVGKSMSSGAQPNPIERRIVDYLREQRISEDALRKTVAQFETYISSVASEFRAIINETGQTGKAVSPTTIRCLLHLSLYKKNAGIPHAKYEEFVRKFVLHQKKNSSIISRFEVPNKEPITVMSLKIDSISEVFRFARAVGVDFDQKRNQTPSAAAGYHQSHVKAFAKHGNGKTFPEPALRNMARGAKDISKEQSDD